MKIIEKLKHPKFKKILLSLLFSIIVTSLILTIFSENKVFVAQVTSSQNDIRRKLQVDEQWTPLSYGDYIYPGDQIYTSEDSTTSLIFHNGLELHLSPQTLIQVDASTSFELKYGSVQTKAEQNDQLTLRSQKTKHHLKFDAGTIAHFTTTNKITRLEVLTGRFSMNGQTIDKQYSVEIDEDGQAFGPVENLIALKKPTQKQSVWRRQSHLVDFSWQKSPLRKYRILVSREPYFERPVVQKDINNQESVTLSLSQNGQYYWRIEEEGNPSRHSLTQSFYLREEEAPLLVHPPDQAHYLAEKINDDVPRLHSPDRLMTFTFKPRSSKTPLPKGYILQISNSSNFSKPIFQVTSSKNRIDELEVPQGTYYWRVKTHDPSRPFALWSEVRTFSIISRDRPLPRPHLLSSQIKKYDLKKVKRNQLQISFDQVFSADAYRFEVRVNQGRSRKIYTQKSPTYQLADITPGVHLIRAQAISKEITDSLWSDTAIAIINGQLKASLNDE